MARIAMIGAGSMVFSKNVISDLLSFEALKGAELALMDIDGERLEVCGKMAESINRTRGADAKITTHRERGEALEGADFVINTIGVGGIEATRTDFRVPEKYGLKQTISDTLGIGGIFRTVRSLPVVLELCWDMEELCPDALMLNYTNPMAMHCLGVQRGTEVEVVGLCHGVRHTKARMTMLARLAEMGKKKAKALLDKWEPREKGPTAFTEFYQECLGDETVEAICAGINHMAAYLVFRRKETGEDLYPLLFEAYEDETLRKIEAVRLELMKRFGYFMTETSGHIAEYLPWFLKSEEEIERLRLRPGAYIGTCEDLEETFREYERKAAEGEEFIEADEARSIEYAAPLINAVVTNEAFMLNGNVHNRGGALIYNLPSDCCVEVPCVADGLGIHPTVIGELPPQCAAMMRTNINVQDLVVQGILEQDREHIYHAAYLDPNASATLTMPEIESMVDDMFEAHGDLMPEYFRG